MNSSCVLIWALISGCGPGEERLSGSWEQNPQANKVIYATAAEMPKGSELRIKIVEAGTGTADIVVLEYNGLGPSPQLKKFGRVSAGQVLKLRLSKKTRIGIMVGAPASATCIGLDDKGTHHTLKYDFGNLGKYTLDAKVVGDSF